jgi:glycerol-3-phosphate dehydrogenase
MNRTEQLNQLKSNPHWDLVIIGGGATGLGSAIDAASRGYKCLLIEQYDFAKGTSSKSTKLLHGGVRYLQQGNIGLVLEALRERGRLLKNASHLSSIQPFIIPIYSLWEKWFYAIGLKIYDLMAGKLSIGKTTLLNKKEVIRDIPNIQQTKIKGGVLYYDGQFDDTALCVDMAATAIEYGATVLNYCKAIEFIKTNKKITGLKFIDSINDETIQINSKAVINATGVFTNAIMQLDDAHLHDYVTSSQGIHLMIDPYFFKGQNAMMIPKTSDGRVLFAVPWYDKVILGTTDTPIEKINIEPKPLEEEIDFIITHFNQYCSTPISKKDILSVYVGLRPLIKHDNIQSAKLSRAHALSVSTSGLITITGGKWTTYRKMAEDAVNNAIFVGKLIHAKCVTKDLKIVNPISKPSILKKIVSENPEMNQLIHENFDFIKAEIIYAIRHQMAMSLEDILARRIRLLYFNAKVAIQVAPEVARIMSKEMNKNADWTIKEINSFSTLASQYIV